MRRCYDRGNGVTALKNYSFRFLLIINVLFIVMLSCSLLYADIDPQYQDRLNYLTERLKLEGFAEDEIGTILADSRLELYPYIVGRSGKGIDYMGRRFGLLTASSIERGQRILDENREVLEDVERSFGVEKEVVVAILRIETDFGRKTGRYPVLNSLLTMVLVENRRSAWAEKELIEFLRICREQNRDPFSVKGSWAGAFGICQFIPSSYVRFAVDGSGDGVVDLFDFKDAVASIANYLKAHGWESGDLQAKRRAIYAYNHCDSYVEAVLAYAKAAKERS
ncbi:MAG TPA: lytic murein transglycosylase [Syntrophorhabdaceae bacterium]|nr:lytic murein transglycosylase [Syntrophorhabdaceae bacterium]HNT67701.1 lytic murein transglycosylase [Syntrophorhabdaceae bacterium]